MPNKLFDQMSRNFLAKHKVHRYRMVKISGLGEQAVIRDCHWYCEENNLVDEFKKCRGKAEDDSIKARRQDIY